MELDDLARPWPPPAGSYSARSPRPGRRASAAMWQKVRMRRAPELLREGDLPVGDVANAVGYRQPAQFAKAFRRHHGAPPSTFRAGVATEGLAA